MKDELFLKNLYFLFFSKFLDITVTTSNIYLKTKNYMNENWNYLDFFGCIIFSIGMGFRIMAYLHENVTFFTTAR